MTLPADEPDARCDVLVVGTGAGGLAAALTARLHGLDVLLIDKAPVFGGTSALSGGGVWAPGNRFSVAAGQGDTPDAAMTYLDALCGNRLDRPVARRFLESCTEAVAYLEANSGLRFGPNPIPDYAAELPGGVAGGRSLRAARFDGRRLGRLLSRLRPPLASTTIFGGMMISAEDLPDLFRAGRSPRSALRVARMLVRHAVDRLRHGRVTRLANGNALVAALMAAYRDAGGRLRLGTALDALTTDATGRVAGGRLRDGNVWTCTATRGVILAGGGAPHGPRAAYDHRRRGTTHRSLAPAENTGDTQRLAEDIGAGLRDDLAEPAALSPVSAVPVGGTTVGFPHFFDRSKPGFIAVDPQGRRFANESDPYHVFGRAMIAAAGDGGRIFLICDHAALRRYGVGPVPPFPGRLSPWLRNGYLRRGADLPALARAIGVDPETLSDTVTCYNAPAATGTDPAFGRGGTTYNRFIGDSAARAPNDAPVTRAPFYAVELLVGDLGTFAGLPTDDRARVLDDSGQPVAGLFAVGNDAASFMGGHYPAAGITLGPALTFGYLAARALV